MSNRIYIAGPMRGRPQYNFPAFDEAKRELESRGWIVTSPADLDREGGLDPRYLDEDHNFDECPEDFDLDETIRNDIDAILNCDAIFLLEDWFLSKGARAEAFTALWAGKKQFFQTRGYPHPTNNGDAMATPVVDSLDALLETAEVRVVDPNTGGEKGSKLARFDLIPSDVLFALAEHYGRGAEKYADRNWERGYDWSLSFAALNRHLWAFWNGEDTDEETGSLHIVAAAWHAFALAAFQIRRAGTDNRPQGDAPC